MRPARTTSTPAAARRCRASGTATPTCWPRCTRSSTSSPTRTPASSPTQVAEELGEDLVAHAPAGIGHVYFVSGGSEAIEAALKMARQYFVEIGQPQRRHFIARRQSYHGNTLGALAVGGNEWRAQAVRAAADRDASRLALLRVSRPARRRDAARNTASGWRSELEAKIDELGPDTVIAFIAETVGGATVGCDPAGRGLLQARPRDLRPPRHPADPRRGHVRHGPHRHAARLRAGRHRARPDGDRQGSGRRLRTDRRGARRRQDVRRVREGLRASSSTATPTSAIRWPARRALAVQQVIRRDNLLANVAPQGAQLTRRLEGALRQPPSRRRRARARPVPGDRAGARTAPPRSRSIPSTSCTPASSRRPWSAA